MESKLKCFLCAIRNKSSCSISESTRSTILAIILLLTVIIFICWGNSIEWKII